MKVLLYKGTSWISKAIRLQTRSQYSHAAIQLDDGSVIEAWQTGGVRQIPDAMTGHAPDTVIDVFLVNTEYTPSVVEAFLTSQVGKDYDFTSVMRFVSRRQVRANDKWFCSELVVAAYRYAGVNLLNGNPSTLSPRDVSLSPLLVYETSLHN